VDEGDRGLVVVDGVLDRGLDDAAGALLETGLMPMPAVSGKRTFLKRSGKSLEELA
jgi:hypothetical protein